MCQSIKFLWNFHLNLLEQFQFIKSLNLASFQLELSATVTTYPKRVILKTINIYLCPWLIMSCHSWLWAFSLVTRQRDSLINLYLKIYLKTFLQEVPSLRKPTAKPSCQSSVSSWPKLPWSKTTTKILTQSELSWKREPILGQEHSWYHSNYRIFAFF